MAQVTQESATGAKGALIRDDNGVPVAFRYYNVAAGTATTEIKGSAGILHGISINTKGATGNTLTIYDNTAGSGTVIATIDTTVAAGLYLYDVQFGTGLTIVSASGTGADYTVIYV